MMEISYIKLHKYKYELTQTLEIHTNLFGYTVNHRFFKLTPSGFLTIFKNYHWDGVSGPMIDTKDSMIGGCVHDALYQMIRLGLIRRNEKPVCDKIMYAIFNVCGMDKVRMTYAFLAVSLFGGGSCVVGDVKIPKVHTLKY